MDALARSGRHSPEGKMEHGHSPERKKEHGHSPERKKDMENRQAYIPLKSFLALACTHSEKKSRKMKKWLKTLSKWKNIKSVLENL